MQTFHTNRMNNWLPTTTDATEHNMKEKRYMSHLFLPYAKNKGADQPAHPHSLISAFIIPCLDSIIPLVFISKISRL